MATLDAYCSKFRLLSKQEIIAQRRELFQSINGDAFFPLKWWPQEYQSMFWAKPIGDKETFKLMMFCLGNTAGNGMDNPLPKLATNQGREKGTSIGFHS